MMRYPANDIAPTRLQRVVEFSVGETYFSYFRDHAVQDVAVAARVLATAESEGRGLVVDI